MMVTRRGFTLLEVLLSVAVVALIAGLSLPLYFALQGKNDLDIAVTTYAQSLRRAEVLARASDSDANWGTFIQNGSITIYRGATYASRVLSSDEVFSLPQTLVVSGLTEVNFAKFSGLPFQTGTTTLTPAQGATRTVFINAKGTVTF